MKYFLIINIQQQKRQPGVGLEVISTTCETDLWRTHTFFSSFSWSRHSFRVEGRQTLGRDRTINTAALYKPRLSSAGLHFYAIYFRANKDLTNDGEIPNIDKAKAKFNTKSFHSLQQD